MIVSLYAALLAILFVVLSIRAIRTRRSLKISLGDAGNQQMLRAVSVHANFAEYTPFTLFLLFLMEVRGGPPALVHALCCLFTCGRLIHAYGVSQPSEDFRLRVAGMAMTFTTILAAAAYLLASVARLA